MVISRTPFRISFFGGGTDYPTWFEKHGGVVLAATIDKYCYLTARRLPPIFEHRFRVIYSKIETCKTVAEIKHPVVKAVLRYLNINEGVEIHHDGDLPARSGMGSSSAFTVGLLHALKALQGSRSDAHSLASESIHLEQQVLRENVGSQDQVQAAYGGLNHIAFLSHGQFSVRPVTLPLARTEELNNHLMLFYTGIVRTASEVAATFLPTLEEAKRRQLRVFKDLVEEGLSVLYGGGDINEFGKLLDEGWKEKRSLSDRVSSADIDRIYETARGKGAIGGKITGAGGGGFLLLFVPPERQDAVRHALHPLVHVPFKFDSTGSQIIYFSSEAAYETGASSRPVSFASRFAA